MGILDWFNEPEETWKFVCRGLLVIYGITIPVGIILAETIIYSIEGKFFFG